MFFTSRLVFLSCITISGKEQRQQRQQQQQQQQQQRQHWKQQSSCMIIFLKRQMYPFFTQKNRKFFQILSLSKILFKNCIVFNVVTYKVSFNALNRFCNCFLILKIIRKYLMMRKIFYSLLINLHRNLVVCFNWYTWHFKIWQKISEII